MPLAEAGIRIGWASESITPDKPVQLMGQFYERISERVRDSIMATALALEADDGSEQAVIVSCDIVNIPAVLLTRVREVLAEQAPAGLDPRKVILAATHTHTAPVMEAGFYPDPPPGVMRPAEYVELLAGRVARAVREAWENRRPGGVSWALGHAAIGFNRRVAYDDGSSKMYGDSNMPHFVGLEGTQDHAIEMLFCWNDANELTGIVINPACPSQVVENKLFVSADYWAAARERVRAAYGQDVFVLGLCAAAGDQSPRDLVRRGRGEPNMRDEDGLEEKGRRIARAVDHRIQTAKDDIRARVALGHVVEDLVLPAKKVTEEQAGQARAELAALENTDLALEQTRSRAGTSDGKPDTARILRLRWEGVLEVHATQPADPRFQMELHVLRIGDVALATNPFELFLDYGLRIKARSRATQTFLAQLSCGDGGYLATAKAVAGAGYGAMIVDGPVGPDGGDVLVERTVGLINAMWD